MFLEKGVTKICSKFTGERPSRSVISIKLQSNFVEIALRYGCSLVNLSHVFRTPLDGCFCWSVANRENIENHLRTLSKSMALYSSSYENLMIMGDFNVCMEEISMSGFCDTFGLKSLTKDATWYQNLENPSSIDLILTNSLRPSRQLHVQS